MKTYAKPCPAEHQSSAFQENAETSAGKPSPSSTIISAILSHQTFLWLSWHRAMDKPQLTMRPWRIFLPIITSESSGTIIPIISDRARAHYSTPHYEACRKPYSKSSRWTKNRTLGQLY